MKKLALYILLASLVCACKKDDGRFLSLERIKAWVKKETTKKEQRREIFYPYMQDGRENLLMDSTFTVHGGVQYSMGAYVPAGRSLRVVTKGVGGSTIVETGVWSMQNDGWIYHNYYPDSMVFEVSGADKYVNIPFQFGPPRTMGFYIYENGVIVPTRVKTVSSQ